ncbi:MAG: AAA family ATPase [Cyanobacteria bacterium P01_B01_bin.77]
MTRPSSTAPSPLAKLSGYTLVEKLYEGTRIVVYRAIQNEQQCSVVIKALRHDCPSLSELVQFRNQYAIAQSLSDWSARNLSFPSIIRPLSLEPLGNGYALVIEDWGGMSLATYLQQQSLLLPEVLDIGVQLANILHGLGQQRVVHKNIKPANILIRPDSKQVTLIDFSLASRLPKETQKIQNPNVLEGTLAYMAPEQTGRMNRGIDYRADFYGLGVTLYQLLSGHLPFTVDDPLELMHCHIAKAPTPVDQINPDVPSMVAAIVTKLMAKNAEDRYQSAIGLKHDLASCLNQWEANSNISAFELGQRDVCDRFLISDRLYGRAVETRTLLAAFDRVAQGATELMLIAGFSGIGKTAVVNEVHKPITRQNGYFIQGKFDQFNRNSPFSAFVQAFRSLIGQLLGESDAALDRWKAKILDAVGVNGQIILEVIPELKQLIGEQPALSKLSGSAAQQRFNLVFSNFVRVFASKDHPLVLFLDDLQWADLASLNLLQRLMDASVLEADSGYLLAIGTYRDSEVFPAHPLILALDEMERHGKTIHTLTLAPLETSDIDCLVADTLGCSVDMAHPLSQLIYQKTQGNPFFTTQFLQELYEQSCIVFDADAGFWQCDLSKVRQLSLTEDVVIFMMRRLQKLSSSTQHVVKRAACVGNSFNLTILAAICESSQERMAAELWSALQEQLIVPENETYKFFDIAAPQDDFSCEQPSNSNDYRLAHPLNQRSHVFKGDWADTVAATPIVARYRFLHDRIQQAAYALIPDDQKQITHLEIGRLLYKTSLDTQLEIDLFDIVNHWNRGLELIDSSTERHQLCQLNLTAGYRAKDATAYELAEQYAMAGIRLLGSWQIEYDMMLALHDLAAEVTYLNGEFDQAHIWAKRLIKGSKHFLDQIKVYEIQILTKIAQKQLLAAIELGRQVLFGLDIDVPATPTDADIQQALATMATLIPHSKIRSLAEVPTMTDRRALAALTILNTIAATVYLAQPKLVPWIVLEQVKLSVIHGNSPISAGSYARYGFILCSQGNDIESGYQFGRLALSLSEKFNNKAINTRVFLMVAALTIPWKHHLSQSLPLLDRAYEDGLASGNLDGAALGHYYNSQSSYLIGQELHELEHKVAIRSQQLRQIKQELHLNNNELLRQVVLNLLGKSDTVYRLVGEAFNEDHMLSQYQSASNILGLYCFHLHKLLLYYWFDQLEKAAEQAILTAKYLVGATAQATVPLFYFYDSLVALAQYDNAPYPEQNSLLKRVNDNKTKLEHWAKFAPMNFQHKLDLVDAEQSRILGHKANAIEAYDRAISRAKEAGYVQEEALANELTAKFYLDWGKEKVAASYFQDAYYCYAHWGATAKTEDLAKRYPHLLQSILKQAAPAINLLDTLATIASPTLTIDTQAADSYSLFSTTNTALDFASVLKSAQAISDTILLNRLLRQLTQIILKTSGGDRCFLILPDNDGSWQLRAMATPDTVQLCTTPLADDLEAPIKLIQYVKHTQTGVVVDNLTTDLPIVDAYLNQHQPQSVLCLPMLYHDTIVGVLYLQNRSIRGVFASDRILVLNFLCAQAAISIENARLYQQAQTYAQQLEASQLQLVQHEKMSALGNLVAGVAHEINNPLSFVDGNVSELRLSITDLVECLQAYRDAFTNPGKEIQELWEKADIDFVLADIPKMLISMETGCDRIRAISTSLRLFSRADADTKLKANIHKGLDSTLLILKYRLKAKDFRPEIEIFKHYGDLPEVKCFPGQLNQVFMNIVANAIDMFDEMAEEYSYDDLEANPQKIMIYTHVVDSGVTVEIGDNGKGMDDETCEKIFERTFTTKPVGKGTGLGLAISRQVIEGKHGGRLTVNSSLGKGTEFVIYLPM